MDFDTPEHRVAVTARAARASQSRIRGWSHVATRVKNLEATRRFYEDLLGLPLVLAHQATDYPEAPGKTTDYMHAFFELGDGSCIAFFQFADGMHGQMQPHSPDMYERHLAMRVDSMDDIALIGERLRTAGLEALAIEHGAFYSMYVNDPDGDTIEITYHRPIVDKLYLQPDPRAALTRWLSGAAAKA